VVCEIKRLLDDGQLLFSILQASDDPSANHTEAATASATEVIARLEQLIQAFQILRQQIASAARLNAPKGFSVESCESQYNRLYGDALVFLAAFLPACLSENASGFVEVVSRKAAEELRKRGTFSVSLTRMLIGPLARLEKLAAQIDGCSSTLETYRQTYFPAS
jgi:hypothetical protein